MKNNTLHAADLDALLRRCVGCGLCLPHCATWAETGNEVFSPRGRLLLLADMLAEPGKETRSAYAEAFDMCIGCKACETACPGGVPYSLLEYGKSIAEANARGASFWNSFLYRRLDSRPFLVFIRESGRLARNILRWVWGVRWRRKLEGAPEPAGQLVRMLGSMPVGPGSDDDLMMQLDLLTGGKSQRRSGFQPLSIHEDVAFFASCANFGLLPHSSRRLIEILKATGRRVHFLEHQECCGALAAHTGRLGKDALFQRANASSIAALGKEMPIVVEAAGCGDHLQNSSSDFNKMIIDANVLLSRSPLPELREIPLTVVYHDPCHALHGQKIHDQPRQLLNLIPGLKVVPYQEEEVCCGSGGAWGLQHQELSIRLGRRKAGHLANSGADLAVTSNPGCLGQIGDALSLDAPGMKIMPFSDLLWLAIFTEPEKKAGPPDGSPTP